MLLLGIQFSEPESSLNTYSSAHGPPNYLISRLEKSTIREVYSGDFSGTVRVYEDRAYKKLMPVVALHRNLQEEFCKRFWEKKNVSFARDLIIFWELQKEKIYLLLFVLHQTFDPHYLYNALVPCSQLSRELPRRI